MHINDQPINDEANVPSEPPAPAAGSGGAAANIDVFAETRWGAVRGQPSSYRF